jgi:hypothetical protein
MILNLIKLAQTSSSLVATGAQFTGDSVVSHQYVEFLSLVSAFASVATNEDDGNKTEKLNILMRNYTIAGELRPGCH